MNGGMDMVKVQKVMMEFEKQNGIMDLNGDMMSETIDSTMGDNDEEVEETTLLSQVFDEIGLDLQGKLKTKELPEIEKESDKKDELELRFERLVKKNNKPIIFFNPMHANCLI